MHDCAAITTIEALFSGNPPYPMQAAFLKPDGFQCRYRTPGQIRSAIGMLEEARRGLPSDVTENFSIAAPPQTQKEIRERTSSNLSRRSAHPNIVSASPLQSLTVLSRPGRWRA